MITGALDRALDRTIAFSDRHSLALSIVGGVWFVASWADTARFVELPKIPLLTDKAAVWISTAYNAIWWGFINPRVTRRRRAHASMNTSGADNG